MQGRSAGLASPCIAEVANRVSAVQPRSERVCHALPRWAVPSATVLLTTPAFGALMSHPPANATPLRRRPRHPRLPGVRRRRHPRLRHRQRPQVRQAHRHAGQPARRSRDNIKGVCACAATKKLYFTTPDEALLRRSGHREDRSGRRRCRSGCDRMSITPDGKTLYVPSFEKDTLERRRRGDRRRGHARSRPRAARTTRSCGLDGTRMYLAGLKSPLLFVADTKTHKVVEQGRPVRGGDPAVHGQRRPDAVLRQRQRPARLRDRRPEDRQEAAPRRGARASRRARSSGTAAPATASA